VKRGWMRFLMALWTLYVGGTVLAADGQALYQTYCAACHQADGQGIPGTYPFLDGPIGRLSSLPEGREFLAATVLFGLKGEMVQRGVTYDGAMPGFAGALSDEEVATLLNWLKAQWKNPELGAGAPDYTPQEVEKVRKLALTPEEVFQRLQAVEAILHRNTPGGGREGCGAPGGRGKGGPGR